MRIMVVAVVLLSSAVPVVAQQAPTDHPDADLVSALVALFNPFAAPGERLYALEAPALHDLRAVPPLVFLLTDSDPTIRAGAAHVLGALGVDPRIEQALLGRALARQEVANVRIAAIDALVQQARPATGEALYHISVDDDEPLEVRAAARRTLEARFPELIARRGGGVVVDRSGRGLLVLGSSALGSFALASVGALGENNAGISIGVLGGLVVGGSAAYVLTRTGEITSAQAGWIVSGGGWGATLGMLAAGALGQNPSTRFVLTLGLAGETLGTASAIATRTRLGYTADQVAMIDVSGLLGFDLAAGVGYLKASDGSQLRSGTLFAAGIGGLVLGGLAAPHMDFHAIGDRILTLDSAYEGLVLGLLAPYALDASSDRHELAGAYLGVGLGFAAGAALAQVTDMDPNDVALAWLIGSYGKLLGLSIPLLGDGNATARARGTIAGSALSIGAAAVLAPRLSLSRGDGALVAVGTGLGLWHGVAFGTSSRSLDGTQQTGLALLGLTAGGLGAMALSQPLDLTQTEVLVLGGGAFWGNWFTLWGTELAKSPGSSLDLRPAAAVGDAGLAVSALLLARVDARRIGIANVGGLAGAGLASLGAALATRNNHAVIAANLIGSGVGLAGGALLASSIDLAPLPARVATSSGPLGLGTPTIGPLLVPPSAGPTVGISVGFVQ